MNYEITNTVTDIFTFTVKGTNGVLEFTETISFREYLDQWCECGEDHFYDTNAYTATRMPCPYPVEGLIKRYTVSTTLNGEYFSSSHHGSREQAWRRIKQIHAVLGDTTPLVRINN